MLVCFALKEEAALKIFKGKSDCARSAGGISFETEEINFNFPTIYIRNRLVAHIGREIPHLPERRSNKF
jgi:hypothetical protein